ncbi:hypothetical protein AB0M83_36695 [Amycolatopsis sp. NPDC051106]|uniref:hypothetical protein n=1 Tax=unclassified Amycolatopsis TaxID=2618356 RepID=UPI00343F4277
MNAKRSNNAICKLTVPKGVELAARLKGVFKAYARRVAKEGLPELSPVAVSQLVDGYRLDLYVRPSGFGQGYRADPVLKPRHDAGTCRSVGNFSVGL